jgi:hypothetical protein
MTDKKKKMSRAMKGAIFVSLLSSIATVILPLSFTTTYVADVRNTPAIFPFLCAPLPTSFA